MRASLHALFKSYFALATVAAFLVLPVSAATLLAQSMTTVSSPALATISGRVASEAAGLPPTSDFWALLSDRIPKRLYTFASTLSFTLTLLPLAKASVFKIVTPRSSSAASSDSLLLLCPSLALTHLFGSLLVLSADATVFALLFLASNALGVLNLPSKHSLLLAFPRACSILYSFVHYNAMVACNISVIISAVDGGSGYPSVLKALVFLRGRAETAALLTLPANLGMAIVEALFQHRVMERYGRSAAAAEATFQPWLIWEAFLLIHMHSFLLVFDTVVTCIILKKSKYGVESSGKKKIDC